MDEPKTAAPKFRRLGVDAKTPQEGAPPHLRRVQAFILATMKERGLNMKEWAEAAHLSDNTIARILKPVSKDVNLGTVIALAEAVNVPLRDVLAFADEGTPVRCASKLPLLGYVEAGDAVVPPPEAGESVHLDDLIADDMEVVEVRDESLEPAYSAGDRLLLRRRGDGVPDGAIYRDCVVQLANDGPVVVKRLRPGSRAHRFDLLGLQPGAQVLENRALDWAAPIELIARRVR